MNLSKKIFFLIATFLCISCSKEKSETVKWFDGSYSGKFTVYYKQQDKTFDGDVQLRFKADSFFCSSNTNRYPAGGSGTYEIIGDQIFFKDKNIWTADFDWALILNHEYTYTSEGKDLILTKAPYQDNSYIYKLKKD